MQEIELPIGPSHPAMKEPERFTFLVDGEKVQSMRMRLGYTHRGVEKLLESKNYAQSIPLIERVCGICQHAHSSCFCWGVEQLAGIEAPPRGQHIRTMMLELERVHSHLLWFAFLFDDIGQKALFMHLMDKRELIMDAFESISGNRVHHAINRIGGVRRDFDDQQAKHVASAIAGIEEYLPKITGYLEDSTVASRLKGVGALSRDEARRLGVVGPVARASGLTMDTRRDHPYGAYPELDFAVITEDNGDCHARALVRARELSESIKIIRECFKAPAGDIAIKWMGNPAEGKVIQVIEAPRGEDMHFIVSDGTDKPNRVRIRPPTYANLASLPVLSQGANIADIPPIIASLDPCFSCTDRMLFVNSKGEVVKRC